MKPPYFLRSETGNGFSLKSLIAFFSWVSVTVVFLWVSYLQGKDFNSELLYSYTFASLVGYGPKLIMSALALIKGGNINSKDLNGNSSGTEGISGCSCDGGMNKEVTVK